MVSKVLLPGAIILTVSILTGCISMQKPANYLHHVGLNHQPTRSDFEVCDSASCRSTTELSYSDNEWRSIEAIFHPKPQTAELERERIKVAIGAMEQIIGAKNDTLGDAPKNQRKLGTGKQIDCIAEAANSTVALILLHQNGLLCYHDVGYPRHRGFTRLRYPHNTATVIERETRAIYSIDSWFFAGGEPAISVPLKQWQSGYSPYKDPDFKLPVVPSSNP